MKETPLIFCAEMVRAYRAGRKSMTRRVIKLTPELKRMGGDLDKALVDGKGSSEEYLRVPCVNDPAGNPWDETVQGLFCPYGEPGTQFWIREAWYDYGSWMSIHSNPTKRKESTKWEGLRGNRDDGFLRPLYVADGPQAFHDSLGNDWSATENGQRKEKGNTYWRKKPSIFLPRWACRMTMSLTRVRVKRLQGISIKDIKAEGFRLPPGNSLSRVVAEHELREVFKRGWNKINDKRNGCTWKNNPWVWILEFEPFKKTRKQTMNNDQSLEKGKQDMQLILNELDQRIKNPQPTDNASDAGQAGFDWAHYKMTNSVNSFIKSIKDDKNASTLLAYYRKGMGTTWKKWRAAEMAKVTKVVKS